MPTVEIPLDKVAELRKRAGMTQAHLARKLGANVTDLCKAEKAVEPGGLLSRAAGVVVEALAAAHE